MSFWVRLFHLGFCCLLCLSKRPSRNSEEDQVTKEERWPEKYSGNMDPGAHTSLVRFTLTHEQALGGACVLVHPAQRVFREYRSCQVRRMSLSYLSCGRAVELEAPLWKQAQCVEKSCKRSQFPCKCEVIGWWQGSDLPWWAPENQVAQDLALQYIGKSWDCG